ncbi:MAG: alcohol dehydrogenase catalytic domain-containing protein, partial [Candidatus Adiutrix sp.]|nr:alcohol dehydrogenase catalytic domain-containing protein [Candidatus Adiutrix sp.]
MLIQAAVLREKNAPLVIEEVEIEDPRDDEVLVKVSHVGMCHTDVSIQAQVFPTPLPVVLGHEGSGYVAKIGKSVRGFKEGDPVIMCYDSCGQCNYCRSGHPTYCELVTPLSFGCKRLDGTSPMRKGNETIWGNFFGQSSFATYSMATPRNLVKLQSDKGLEYFGPLGCGFQTGAGAVINGLKVGMGEHIAVFGVGSVGLCGIMAANLVGADKI